MYETPRMVRRPVVIASNQRRKLHVFHGPLRGFLCVVSLCLPSPPLVLCCRLVQAMALTLAVDGCEKARELAEEYCKDQSVSGR